MRAGLGTRLRSAYYRFKYQYLLRKASFGRNLRVQCRLEIKGPGKVVFGDDCVVSSDPWREDFVTIFMHSREARVMIGHRAVLRATRIGCSERIEIGDDALVECASMYDTDFHSVDASRRNDRSRVAVRSVSVGRGAYVGCECMCGKGTQVGENAALLPGTVLSTKTIPDAGLATGNPGRVLRPAA